MRRRERNLLFNWILLFAGFAAYATGIVLLLRLHMGPGAFAASAFGVGRLIWLDIHRISAALTFAAVIAHLVLHWRAFRGRIVKVFNRRTKHAIDSEILMYAAFTVSFVAGLTAWLIVGGSSPFFGPLIAGHASGVWHHWIDVHHLASLVSLVFVVHHVGHRVRFMLGRRRILPVAKSA
jgi:hypothetical protein